MVSRVLPDANVLYSRAIRDWVLMLAKDEGEASMKLYWTDDIIAEVLANRRKKNPHLTGGEQSRLRDRLESTMAGGRIEDFDPSESYKFADLHDRHVDAAARACSADYVVTSDCGFFDESVDHDLLPYEVYTPDGYLQMINEYLPDRVSKVTMEQHDYWRAKLRNDYTSNTLYEHLVKAECPKFAASVREVLVRTPTAL